MNPVSCRRLLLPNTNNASEVAPTAATMNDAAAVAYRRQLDSSVALTIIVLVTAFFFVGLLSFYIRRSSAEAPASSREEGSSAATLLPLVAYTKQRMMEECPICLTDFDEGETLKLIPYCGHVFHTKCLDTWLQLHVTCPLCRSHQLFRTLVQDSN